MGGLDAVHLPLQPHAAAGGERPVRLHRHRAPGGAADRRSAPRRRAGPARRPRVRGRQPAADAGELTRPRGSAMPRHVEITLERRGARCVARLLDEQAPRTCAALWDALPQGGDAFHGKYARNEIYTLVEDFAPADPGQENTTITPIPGDVCAFW